MNIVMTHGTTMAITTKFIGPTNHRGARVKASCKAGTATISWNHGKSIEENHTAAATTLAAELGWDGEWTMGRLNNGYVFCRA